MKARRQEQEDARDEVTEVAPGVMRMELPIRMPGLGHVNCYALEDGDGIALVDPGLPGPASYKALMDRLKRGGFEPRHVHSVIVTHSHPDHFGGADRLARDCGAKVIAHRSFGWGSFGQSHDHGEEPEVSVDDLEAQKNGGAAPAEPPTPSAAIERRAMSFHHGGTTPWGGAAPRPPLRSRLRYSAMRMIGRRSFLPAISDPVEHGDVLHLAGREWFVLHTPGHTSDHFCLHDPAEGTFLAGDHVLPTITPHISGITSAPDPLRSFFYALDRVGEIEGVRTALPAHGHPFADLRKRAEAIKRHHDERLERVKEISGELGPATVEQFTQHLFKRRSWGSMAESETYAHLEHLRLGREAERYHDDDGKLIYVTR